MLAPYVRQFIPPFGEEKKSVNWVEILARVVMCEFFFSSMWDD
jgi:hypothetical protein